MFDNNVKLIALNPCKCGRKAYRSVSKGYSKLGTPYYRESVSCRRRGCKRKEFFIASRPNKATKDWNRSNPVMGEAE